MDTQHTEIQPQELARSEAGWENFVRASRIICIVVAVILVLMAVFLL